MDSRSRVYAALRREPVDRIPVWMWFHPVTTKRLAAFLEVPADLVADALGDDIRQTWVGNNHPMEGVVVERDGETHTDFWGIEWEREGGFNQVKRSPLSDADTDTARAYRYPHNRIDELLTNMEPVVAQRGDRFVGCDISPCVFELVNRVRGMEQTLLDMGVAPDLSADMLSSAADFSVALAEAACERFDLDWLWTGDDVGSQRSMMMSPECWRETVGPNLARVVDAGKSRGVVVAYHSCGSIRPIVPDLIEIGVDVLNPIQCNCPGMDPIELKREYGADLAFFGGVDTQGLLPSGTEDEVYGTTARLVEAMTANGGGYILGASHTVPPETPIGNILAMYRAAGISREEIMDRAANLRQQSGE